MGTFYHFGALDAGENYTMLATVTIPERIFGPFVIRVNTDSRNQVYEHANENDNFASSLVILGLVIHVVTQGMCYSGRKRNQSTTNLSSSWVYASYNLLQSR